MELFEKNYNDNGIPKDVEVRMDELAEKAQKLRDDIGSNIETKRAEDLRDIRNDIWETLTFLVYLNYGSP